MNDAKRKLILLCSARLRIAWAMLYFKSTRERNMRKKPNLKEWYYYVNLGEEYQLFKSKEDCYNYYNKGIIPAYVQFDVEFEKGSSWIEFGGGVTQNPYCDDNIVYETENIVPWQSENFFKWISTLEEIVIS